MIDGNEYTFDFARILFGDFSLLSMQKSFLEYL